MPQIRDRLSRRHDDSSVLFLRQRRQSVGRLILPDEPAANTFQWGATPLNGATTGVAGTHGRGGGVGRGLNPRGRITGSLLSSCSDEKVEERISSPVDGPWRIFTYKELNVATNGFSEEHKHGNGGFRSVYWGKTSDGLQIAVKKLKSINSKKEMEFAVEVKVLGRGLQLKELDRGADIIMATPGRLNHILEMKKIDFRQISLLVLDEADRMLDMGFEPQFRKIVNEIPARRQTLMYTATWPKKVRKIAGDLLVNPVQVNIGKVDELAANKSITQYQFILDAAGNTTAAIGKGTKKTYKRKIHMF
ncbi:hypothetical protein AgCh_031379 [Apium graveolens]